MTAGSFGTLRSLAERINGRVIGDPEVSVDGLAAVDDISGAALTFAFLSLRVVYRSVRGREGIGLGDVKLASVAGVWLYWSMVPIAIEIAALAALAVYAVRHFYSGRTVRSMTMLPFGLFFAPAIWLGWLLQSTLFLIPSTPSFQ